MPTTASQLDLTGPEITRATAPRPLSEEATSGRSRAEQVHGLVVGQGERLPGRGWTCSDTAGAHAPQTEAAQTEQEVGLGVDAETVEHDRRR